MTESERVDGFKFQYVSGGNRAGFRALRGHLTDEGLNLGEEVLPYEYIVETTTRGKRLLLALSDDARPSGKLQKYLVEGRAVILEPKNLDVRVLERAIDRRCAEVEAAQRRAALVEQGLEHLLRSEECPVCGSTVDLSGIDTTPYVYCRFCESIFSHDHTYVTDGGKYRVCDECGMFDRVQEYPEFYFYFLLVVYGFRYQQRFLCDTCAHRLFLKALGLNALFLIGVPTAVWVKVKSVLGREPGFAGLATANSLARKGKHQDANPHFDAVLSSWPDHPAVLMNEAMGHLLGGDQTGGVTLLGRSMEACNHYIPVLRLLRPLAEAQEAP